MERSMKRWLAMLLLVASCMGLAACGGGDDTGETVIGDSAEGVELDDTVADEEGVEGGDDSVDVEGVDDEDESTTDGQ